MENTQTQRQARQIAYKVPITALLRGQYIEQEGWNPNFIHVNEKKVSRANIIATLIDKQITDSLATLTLDDSTGVIQARLFNQDIKKAHEVNIGDPILAIGRPRKYNDTLFLNLEILKKLDPLWMKIRHLELKSEFNFSDQPPQPVPQTPIPEPASNLNQSSEKLLNLIKEKDLGDGADMNEILTTSGLEESEAQTALSELIKLGEVYEPKPNKIKVLG